MMQEITNIFNRPRHKLAETISHHAKRGDDAILIVRQNNLQKTLKIEALNLLAIRMLGYQNEEVVEHDLSLILTDSVNALIYENLEFDNHGKGIDSILNRITDFKIKAKDNFEITVKIKIIRSLSSKNIERFQLVLNDTSLMQNLEDNRAIYRAYIAANDIFDKKTALLSKISVLKDMELIAHYNKRSLKESCFVIYKLLDYGTLKNKHSDESANGMLRSMIKTIEATKRADDIVGIIEKGAVIVVLPETPFDNIKIAINRIYDKFPAEIKSEIRINYDVMNNLDDIETQIDNVLKGKAGTF